MTDDARVATDVLRVETCTDGGAKGWLKLAVAAVASAVTESANYAPTFVRVIDIETRAVVLEHRHSSPDAASADAAYIEDLLNSMSVKEFREAYSLDA
jgi:hypothetical protein